MKEKLFKEIALKDLQKLNDLVLKHQYNSSSFDEAVLNLSNTLAFYHQEVTNANCKEGEYLQESGMAKGA